jgi:hypothetical protein
MATLTKWLGIRGQKYYILSMDIVSRIENIDRVATTSFAVASLRYGVDFSNTTIYNLESKLVLLLERISEKKLPHNGFEFTAPDVQQWIEDLPLVLNQYKLVNSLEHIPSYLKLRDIVKGLAIAISTRKVIKM